jgi:hypothetical protein
MTKSTSVIGLIAGLGLAGVASAAEVGPLDIPMLSMAPQAAASSSGSAPVSIASTTKFRLRIFAVAATASADASAGDPVGGRSTEIDYENDLGMDMSKQSAGGSIGFNMGANNEWHLDIGMMGYWSYSGTSANPNRAFEGTAFTSTTNSVSRVWQWEATLLYDILKTGPVTFGVGGGIRLYDIDLELRSGTTSRQIDFFQPVPIISGSVRWDITSKWYLKAGVGGIYLGEYGQHFEFNPEVGFDLTRTIGVYAGYRYTFHKLEPSDKSFDWRNNAFILGLELRF